MIGDVESICTRTRTRTTQAIQLSPIHFPSGVLSGELYDNGRKLVLAREFVFVDPGKLRVTLPVLATTDFNSTPRIVWAWMPPWEHPEAGAVHDWLYRYPMGFSRNQCDQVHRRILELTGASRFKSEAAYRALQIGGGASWDRYRAMERRRLVNG